MEYTKQTWKTGDIITEEKLNHIEDGIANSGYTITKGEDVVIFSGDVTTEGDQDDISSCELEIEPIGDAVPPKELSIRYDDVAYVTERQNIASGFYSYGAHMDEESKLPDFSEYPFCVILRSDGGFLATPIPGHHDIFIQYTEKNITPTEEFIEATQQAIDVKYDIKVALGDGGIIFNVNNTPQDIYELLSVGADGRAKIIDVGKYTMCYLDGTISSSDIEYVSNAQGFRFYSTPIIDNGTLTYKYILDVVREMTKAGYEYSFVLNKDYSNRHKG